MAFCGACGNTQAHSLRVTYGDGGRRESCDRCGGTFLGVPDVYFKAPYFDENIASEEHPGPKFITSKRQKAEWLKKCDLREAGDRSHGASSFDPISHRHAMESLRRKTNVQR